MCDLRGQLRQHGLEVDGEDAEGFDTGRAHFVQALLHAFFFGQLPRLVLIHVFVHAVGQRHDLAHGLGVFALGIQRGDWRQRIAQLSKQRLIAGGDCAQPPVKPFADKARRPAGDIDVFANQVGIDARHEVVGIKVDVFVACRELGR